MSILKYLALFRTIQCPRPRTGFGLLIGAFLFAPGVWGEDTAFDHPLTSLGAGALHAQDPVDIRRTAEAVYGFSLSEAQLERTRTWNTRSLEWWRAGEREATALDLLVGLYRTGSTQVDIEQLRQSLAASEVYFGIEVSEVSKPAGKPGPGGSAAGGGEPEYFVYSISYGKRPDLASYKRALLGFADQFQAADDAGKNALFSLIFEHAGLGTSSTAQVFSVSSLAGLVDTFLLQFEDELEARRRSNVDSLFEYHKQLAGSQLDPAAFEELEIAGFEARIESLELAADLFFQQLSDMEDPNYNDLGAQMIQRLIELWLAGGDLTIQHPSNGKRAEIAAALSNALAGP